MNTPHETPPDLPADLAHAIVRGAVDTDPVRLHGAIVAVLETHADSTTRQAVFHLALAELADQPRRHSSAATAIGHHLAIYQDKDVPQPAARRTG